jgi:membrane protease YdiL (CAAX protease family)
MSKFFSFYVKAFFIISFISVPFIFISFSDMNKNELTYKLWISSFFPQLIYIIYLLKKYNLFKEFKEGFIRKKNDYKTITFCFLIPYLIYILLKIFGLIKIDYSINWDFNIIIYFILIFFSALVEEVLFRFIPYTLWNDNITTKKIISISLFFSLFHLFNPNFSVIGIINIIIVGVFFSFLYLKNKSIILVTVIHALWNFSIGCVLGSNVSGLKVVSLLKYSPQKSDFLSGGQFGFEGSIITTLIFLIYSVVLYSKRIRQ